MSRKLLIGIFFCLCAELVKGQLGVWLQKDNVYIYPRVEVAYDEMAEQCEKYEAVPAVLDSENVIEAARDARTGHKTDRVWSFNNQNISSGFCESVDLNNGDTKSLNCSEKRPFVCVGNAIMLVWPYQGFNYSISEVKLRYTDAFRVCNDIGVELNTTSGLAIITSSDLQDILSAQTQSNDVGYWISRENKNPANTGGFENWVENRTAIPEADSCIHMKPNGKWDNDFCYNHIRFICQLKDEGYQPATEATTTKMPDKDMVTTKTSPTTDTVTMKKSATEALEPTTTTVAPTTTSGAGMIGNSVIMILALAIATIKMLLD